MTTIHLESDVGPMGGYYRGIQECDLKTRHRSIDSR